MGEFFADLAAHIVFYLIILLLFSAFVMGAWNTIADNFNFIKMKYSTAVSVTWFITILPLLLKLSEIK